MLTPGHVGQPPLPAAAHRPQHGMYTLARVIWASRGLLARKTAGQRSGEKFISFATVYIPGKGVYTPDKGVANPATPDAYQDEAGRRETPGPPARPVLLGHPSCRHGQSGPPEDPVLSATAGWRRICPKRQDGREGHGRRDGRDGRGPRAPTRSQTCRCHTR